MNELMQRRSALLATRLAALLLLVLAVGITLAVLIRKKQSLQKTLLYQTRINANLTAMQENNRLRQEQIGGFRLKLTTSERQSRDVQLYRRVDQIKEALKPLDLQVTAVEEKDGTAQAGFTLKLPYTSYERTINAMGRLQTEPLPLIVFNGISLNAPPATDFTVEGSVLMPVQPGTLP